MKKLISALILSLLICTSCYDDGDKPVADIKAFAFYETTDNPGIKKPDIDAKVFLLLQNISGRFFRVYL